MYPIFLTETSDIVGEANSGQDILVVLPGQEMTNYFTPPLVLARLGLVTDNTLNAVTKIPLFWNRLRCAILVLRKLPSTQP
jgi:hypothetical protein